MSGVVLTVSQLNRYAKSLLDGDARLQSVFVQGEISNFTNHYRTGHYYMTIKDEAASIRAVMFKSANARLRFLPENAMRVIIRGRVSIFERDGQYQLYIDDMQPDGAGALSLAFEQLKQKLSAEGLFAQERKRQIPAMPARVGVVTSPTGAAIHDIMQVISRRFPLTELVLCPVAVQGASAAPQIAAGIARMNALQAADVLIVGRGGGSVEDLWAFNTEEVARAVAASEIPVISAVGHETDVTICDLAADLRAPTPSAAAELAVPDQTELRALLAGQTLRLRKAVTDRTDQMRSALQLLGLRLERTGPQRQLDDLRVRCDRAVMALDAAAAAGLSSKQTRLAALCAKLDAMRPLRILSSGYSIAQKDGVILTDAHTLAPGDRVTVQLSKGGFACEVTEIKDEIKWNS
ncbi:MAG: exodeoxyribonuclease VII large subunit [Clostridia bacterium]|nr:exodeoxyribonuclease VII large subunit [Clostridia bacterium]